MARASSRGYRELLEGDEKLPTKAEYLVAVATDPLTPQAKTTIKAYENGSKAYDELLLSISHVGDAGRTAFSVVQQSVTTENLGDDAVLAWTKLNEKYKPKNAPKYIKLHREFTNLKLEGDNADPDTWITKLERLKMDMN